MPGPLRTLVAGIAEVQTRDPLLTPALELAARLGAKLVLVHAFRAPARVLQAHAHAGLGREAALRHYAAGLREMLEADLHEGGGPPAAQVEIRVREGDAPQVLMQETRSGGADLLLVGASRHATVVRTLLGTSTSARVLRAARLPVLVLRGASYRPLERVLVATDLSRSSAQAHRAGLEVVAALPGGAEAEVRSVFVAPEPELVEHERAELDHFLAELPPRHHPVEPRVRVGLPTAGIVAEAAEWGAGLLVLGTHGRTGAARLLLGSVAEATLRAAPCSVLVIPTALSQSELVWPLRRTEPPVLPMLM